MNNNNTPLDDMKNVTNGTSPINSSNHSPGDKKDLTNVTGLPHSYKSSLIGSSNNNENVAENLGVKVSIEDHVNLRGPTIQSA